MLEIAIVLIVGFALGYGVREWVSRRRRQAERQRHTLWGPPPEAVVAAPFSNQQRLSQNPPG
jgi:hypothetical protein